MQYLQDPNDLRRGQIIVPDQVWVKKCTGSCLNSVYDNIHHQCIAIRKRIKRIRVMYQEVPNYSYQLPPPTGSEICTEVEVEDDLECNCGCQLACNDFQHFDPVSCQCNCNNTAEMQGCISQGSHKEWDQESCLCRCTEKNKACSFGYVYDAINTCRLVWHFRYDLYQ